MDESLTPHLDLEDLRWLHGLARRLVQDPDEAEDAVQDTVLAALTRAPRRLSAPRGWLARVLQNVVRQGRRGAARRLARERERGAHDEVRPTVEVVEELAWHRTLVDEVNALSEPYRSTIALRFLRDRSPREIAQEQGLPVKTVHTRIERGLAHLRRALDRRHGGDRRAWMPAVAALGVPTSGGLGTGTLVMGGIAMGTTMKVSGAVLVAAICLYFAFRSPRDEPPPVATIVPPADDETLAGDVDASKLGSPAAAGVTEVTRRSAVAEDPPVVVSELTGPNVLRVILEGIPEEAARMATVTLSGLDLRDHWPKRVAGPWPCEGLTSDFDLEPLLARMERLPNLRNGELEIAADHPHFLGERTRVLLADEVGPTNGKTLHEVRVRMVRPEFWPEFDLAVRDAHTGEHLEDVELRIRSGPGAAFWGRNPPSTRLGDGLSSPIALMGGREAGEREVTVAGMALSPQAGAAPRLVELVRRWPPERGVIVSARAPGYAWGSTSLDVSKGERELLLEPAATLDVSLTNVQLERYTALETLPMLCIYRIRPDGGYRYVHFERLDGTLESEGLRTEGLVPGEYRVTVELGGGSWTEQPVLAREELSLAEGQARELVLALADPPAPPERADLAGVVSFPMPSPTWSDEKVRLQLYFQPTQRWMTPDLELSLSELERLGGALPTWSFRVEDLPVGMYRVQLFPFLKVWMIDLRPGGAEDLELLLPELAEVLVETVDGGTGARVPRSHLYYRNEELAPGQRQTDLARADVEEPGRFRFWAAPGAVRVWPKFPNGSEREFGGSGMDLELVPGFQSVRFAFEPVYALRFEFREDGTALPTGPQGLDTTRDIRAVDHEGRVTAGGLQRNMRVEVSAPGLYEIRFEGLDPDRYHPIAPRFVDVRAGETVEVLVELRRR